MNNIIPVVRVILQNKNKEILFLKRANTSYCLNQFCLPGGTINFNETALEAVKRETKEETNLDLSNIRFIFYEDSLPSRLTPLHCIVFYFIADFNGKIKFNEESSDYKWISYKEIDKYKIAFNHKEMIKKFIYEVDDKKGS